MSTTMNTLATTKFGSPSCYELLVVEAPNVVDRATDILIEVHAASINPHDVVMASGKTKMLQNVALPYRLGLDFAGVVRAVGAKITSFKKGDRVYGFNQRGATVSELLLIDISRPHMIAEIPEGLSMVQAASLGAVALTADRALRSADHFFASEGGLSGKTVFIPAALSGTGSMALQIAKREWKCRTITAVSTSKVEQVAHYLGPDVVDQIIDYTNEDVVQALGKGKVDFVFDTTGLAGDYVPLIRKNGLCLSIARLPPGSALKDDDPNAPKKSRLACIGQGVMDGMDATFRLWAKASYGVVYQYQKTVPQAGDAESINSLISRDIIRPVIGKTVSFHNIEEIRTACMVIHEGKGSIGKLVIEISKD